MELDRWTREDVQHVLIALAEAGPGQSPGYHLALHHTALALGLVTPARALEMREGDDPDGPVDALLQKRER